MMVGPQSSFRILRLTVDLPWATRPSARPGLDLGLYFQLWVGLVLGLAAKERAGPGSRFKSWSNFQLGLAK